MLGIEDVVLNHEQDVEEHADAAQSELHNVALQTGPLVFSSSLPTTRTQNSAIHKELNNRERASGEVQQDVVNGPADTAIRERSHGIE